MQRTPSPALTKLDAFFRLLLGPSLTKQVGLVVEELEDGLEAVNEVFRVFGLLIISLVLENAQTIGINQQPVDVNFGTIV